MMSRVQQLNLTNLWSWAFCVLICRVHGDLFASFIEAVANLLFMTSPLTKRGGRERETEREGPHVSVLGWREERREGPGVYSSKKKREGEMHGASW